MTSSGVEVAGRDIVCLILIFILLIYSCINCYNQWKKNYQLIDGDFVFKGFIEFVSLHKSIKHLQMSLWTNHPRILSPHFKTVMLSAHFLLRETKRFTRIRDRQGQHQSSSGARGTPGILSDLRRLFLVKFQCSSNSSTFKY